MKKPRLLHCLAAAFLVLQFSSLRSSAQASLNYDGVDDFVSLPSGVVSTLNGDFTIEAWVYWRGASNSNWQRVFDFGSSTTYNMFLTTNGGINAPRFAITTSSGSGEERLSASAPLSLNTWHHLAVVVVNATNTGTLYIDGVSAAVNTSMTLRPSVLGTTTNNYLGRSQYADPYFNGYMDEFRISNSARYLSNFTPTTDNFTVDANTVALYHFDEASGQTVIDAKGSYSGFLGATTAAEATDPSRATLTTLPVVLQNFRAVPAGADVKLSWQTSSEQSNKGFHIERSANGTSFSTIGFIASGATNGSYTYTDAALRQGTVYYRLKQEDRNGRFNYSPVVSVALTDKKSKIVWFATGGSTVQVRLDGGSNENFTLTDVNGRKVQQGSLSGGKAEMSSLTSGIYTITIQTKQGENNSAVIRL